MEPINNSGLEPRGVAVLLEPHMPEVKKSIIEIPEDTQTRLASVDFRARVLAIGPEAWADEKAPRARPGELVLVTKYAGLLVKGPADGKQYRLVNDRDIFCAVTKEAP